MESEGCRAISKLGLVMAQGSGLQLCWARSAVGVSNSSSSSLARTSTVCAVCQTPLLLITSSLRVPQLLRLLRWLLLLTQPRWVATGAEPAVTALCGSVALLLNRHMVLAHQTQSIASLRT
jgi:hypothetical protein